MSTQVFITLPHPFSPLHIHLPPSTPLSSLPLPSQLNTAQTYLRTTSHPSPLSPFTQISSLQNPTNPSHPIQLDLCVRLSGGKGGFGSQLRAAGGRMSTGKSTNLDSCRDLSGRRLSTIKEAQRQAELLESAPALRAAAIAADKAKLEALERSLGITHPDFNRAIDPTNEAESSSSSSPPLVGGKKRQAADVNLEELAMKKHKFEDNGYFEESREINDGVRNAVAAGLLKKKKKKVEGGNAGEAIVGDKGKGKGKEAVGKALKDTLAMPPPALAGKIAAVA